jgi:predicted glycosyltransferase
VRVLFDIIHPADVHFFRFSMARLKERGDAVLVAAREKDVTTKLLTALGIDFVCLSVKGESMASMARELVVRNWRLMREARRFRPDVMVSRVGPAAGPTGKLLGIPTVIYDDMESARLQGAIGLTFATYICTGLGYFRDHGRRHVRFAGPPVLSYLAPKYFTPSAEAVRQSGIDPEQPYFFVRTVSWKATHDVGRKGFTGETLRRVVERLRPYGRIVISAEDPLPEELREYENPAPVERVHDLLAFAALSFVEGGTMAAESAVLGVPAICPNTYDFGYLRALDREYGLIFRPKTVEEAMEIAEEILRHPERRAEFARRRQRLLAESEDVVEFMVRIIDRAAGRRR